MELPLEQVRRIANLARIELNGDEEESFRHQLSSVLEYVGQLSECDTEGVAPMTHVVPLVNATRPDEVIAVDEETRDRLLEAFPDREGDLLKVKAIFS